MNPRKIGLTVTAVALGLGLCSQAFAFVVINKAQAPSASASEMVPLCGGNPITDTKGNAITIAWATSTTPQTESINLSDQSTNCLAKNNTLNVEYNEGFGANYQVFPNNNYPFGKQLTAGVFNSSTTTVTIPANPKLYGASNPSTSMCLEGGTNCTDSTFKAGTPAGQALIEANPIVPLVKLPMGYTTNQNDVLFDITNYFADKNNTANGEPNNRMWFQCAVGANADYPTPSETGTCAEVLKNKLGLASNVNNKNQLYTFWGTLDPELIKQNCSTSSDYPGYYNCSIKFTVYETCSAPGGAGCHFKYKPVYDPKKTYKGSFADPVNETLQLWVYSGFIQKSLSDIQKDETNGNLTLTNVPLVPTANGVDYKLYANMPITGGGHLGPRYFTLTPDLLAAKDQLNPKDVTYSIVQNNEAVPGRQGNWGPVVVYQPTQTPQAVPAITIKQDANGNVLHVATTSANYEGIIQVTLKASYTPPGKEKAEVAYRTIYLNISPKNSSVVGSTGVKAGPAFTPLKPFNSAYVYNTNSHKYCPVGDTSCQQQSNSSAGVTQTCPDGSTADYPNCKFVPQINSNKIDAIYPDIGWISFPASAKTWNPSLNPPLANNINTKSTPLVSSLDDVLKYYKTNVTNADFKFIVTYEFDTPVRALVPSIQMYSPPDEASTPSQMSVLAHTIADPLTAVRPNGYSYDGLQLDVEPFSSSGNAPEAYKRMADIMARSGKIFEIYAFADTMTPALIMAMGPYGILIPSTYDVGQQLDTKYTSTYQNNFKLVDNKSTDFACHVLKAAPAGKVPAIYYINKYCNTNIINTLNSNTSRFNLDKTADVFPYNVYLYGGSFQMAIPTEGSATNWTYNKVYRPQAMANIYGSGGNGVPSVPSTWTQYTGSGTWEDFVNNHTTGQYFGYGLNGSQTDPNTVPNASSYIIVNANPNNEPTWDGKGPVTSQAMYVYHLLNYFNDPNTFLQQQGLPAQSGNALFGSPTGANANPRNLGLAMYALAVPESYGCQPGGNHGGSPNCLVPYPISTPNCVPEADVPANSVLSPYAKAFEGEAACPSGQVYNPIWQMAYQYTHGGQPSGPGPITAAIASKGSESNSISGYYKLNASAESVQVNLVNTATKGTVKSYPNPPSSEGIHYVAFTGLPAGSYQFVVMTSSPSGTKASNTITIGNQGGAIKSVNVLHNGSKGTASIIYYLTGKPSSVSVSLLKNGATVKTLNNQANSSGEPHYITFSGLQPGTYTIKVIIPSDSVTSAPITVD